jgi:hypothetical protein
VRYMHLLSQPHLLTITRDSYLLLLDKVSTGTLAMPMLATMAHEMQARIHATSQPLSRDNHLNVTFWTRQEWVTFKNDQKNISLHASNIARHKEKHTPSKSLAYVMDIHGNGVNGYQAAAICATTRQVLAYITKEGHAPMTWSQANISAMQYHHQEMYRDHPL